MSDKSTWTTKASEESNITETTIESLKARGIRLSDDVMDRFRDLTQRLGGNQQQALVCLMDHYSGSEFKESHPDSVEDINNFEAYQEALKRLFLTQIDLKKDAKEIAKKEFSEELESNNKIIKSLQTKIEELESQLNEANNKLNPTKDALTKANQELSDLNRRFNQLESDYDNLDKTSRRKLEESENERKDLSKTLAEKTSIYDNNVHTLIQANEKNEELRKTTSALQDVLSKLKNKNTELEIENAHIQADNEKLSQSLESLKATKEAEIKLAVEQAEVKAKAKYLELLEEKRNEYIELGKQLVQEKSNNAKTK